MLHGAASAAHNAAGGVAGSSNGRPSDEANGTTRSAASDAGSSPGAPHMHEAPGEVAALAQPSAHASLADLPLSGAAGKGPSLENDMTLQQRRLSGTFATADAPPGDSGTTTTPERDGGGAASVRDHGLDDCTESAAATAAAAAAAAQAMSRDREEWLFTACATGIVQRWARDEQKSCDLWEVRGGLSGCAARRAEAQRVAPAMHSCVPCGVRCVWALHDTSLELTRHWRAPCTPRAVHCVARDRAEGACARRPCRARAWTWRPQGTRQCRARGTACRGAATA
jgi:hypothetical protein